MLSKKPKRITISKNLTLMGLAFGLPLAVMLYFFISTINSDIAFSQAEKYGNAYQRPLEKLLQGVTQHKYLSEYASNGTPLQESLASVAERIDRDFAALAKVDHDLGRILQTDPVSLAKRKREHYQVATLAQEWQNLKTQSGSLNGQQHIHLIGDIRALISHIGDTSNLILDPDLDSYYLMDVTLLVLPQMQDRLQEIFSYGNAILSRQAVSATEKIQLSIYAAFLKQSDLDRLKASVQTALNEDANFYGISASLQQKLPPLLLDNAAAIEAFIQLIQQMATSGVSGLKPAQFRQTGEQAIAASFTIFDATIQELDVLLDVRLTDYRQYRMALFIGAVVLMLYIGFILLRLKKIGWELEAINNDLQFQKSALDHHAIVSIADARGKITYANEKFLDISQYSKEELLGQDHRIVNSGLHPKDFFTELWGTISSGKVWHGEIRNRKKDGSFYWVATTIVPFLDHEGKHTQYISIRTDITRREEAEVALHRSNDELEERVLHRTKALNESEARFRSVFKYAQVGMSVADVDLRYLEVNPAFVEMTGYSENELLGYTFRVITHPDDVESSMARRNSLLTGERNSYHLEKKYIRKDGNPLWADVTTSAARDSAGKVMSIIGIIQDITQRKRNDDLLVASNAQAQLLLSQLRQINEENNMLVYSVSHDLRSPLVNLQGFSKELVTVSADLRGLLTSDGVPAEIQKRGIGMIDIDMQESINFILAGVTRLSNIIDAMLRLSRAGKVEYYWSEVDTGLVVQRIVDSMQAVAGERGAAVTVSDLPPVWGDATAIEQIFANLIGNALNYLDPKRPGLIEIGWQADADNNAFMHTYYVRDNGLGMSEAAKGKLFQIFQRFHPDKAKGEGVGLSIVRKMVERHSGKIWVESHEGVGTTFFISLPIQAMEEAA